jgi:DNA-directed RNA polymerase alpha subunit
MDNINVKISNLEENDEVLKFTLSNVNVSYANSLRRTILANIPLLVFRTQPYDRNNVNIKANKTRLNNELLKQRISCIPIHITEISDFPYQDYVVELNKENNTSVIDFVTTEDFKIKNIKLDSYLTDSEVKQIFPPDPITQDYIDIVRLRPIMSENIECD